MLRNDRPPSTLLVSVRDVAETQAALAGGAALIDIKEPGRGALGRADNAVIQEVVASVAGQCPVSAALGEWVDDSAPIAAAGLTYVKWGLAGCQRQPNWRRHLGRYLERRERPQLVLVAYADWQCAQAPAVEEVFALARDHPGSVMLLDTHCKDGNNVIRKERPTLLDWLPLAWVEDFCGRCQEAKVKIALAGSLGIPEIRALMPARPTWFAVRGAVCADGDRQSAVQTEKVRQIVGMLQGIVPTSLSVS